MRPEYFLIPAVVLIAIIAIASNKKDKKVRDVTTRLPDVQQPSEAPLVVWGRYPYHLDVQRGTRPGLNLPAEYWQRYTDTADMAGVGAGHHSTNLGHDESIRSARAGLLPAGEGAPTTGVGAVEGYFVGHPDLPEEVRSKHIAVLENFDKVDVAGKPVRTLIGESAVEIPSDGLAVRDVLVHTKGETRRCRYTLHRPGGELLADTGWHTVEHSQPLGGPDVARALWPAGGKVDATGCSVTWSTQELQPQVPAPTET